MRSQKPLFLSFNKRFIIKIRWKQVFNYILQLLILLDRVAPKELLVAKKV